MIHWRRLVCAIFGHSPGRELYGYVYPDGADLQQPGRTYSCGVVGFECRRCFAVVRVA